MEVRTFYTLILQTAMDELFRMDGWRNYVVTILEYLTLVVTIFGELFGGILSVTILLYFISVWPLFNLIIVINVSHLL